MSFHITSGIRRFHSVLFFFFLKGEKMYSNDTLQHHGVKGMHWGVRKDKNVQSAKASMKADKKASKKAYNKYYNDFENATHYDHTHIIRNRISKNSKAKSNANWRKVSSSASKSNAKKAAYKQSRAKYKAAIEQAKSKSVTRQQHKAAVQNAKKASISLARVAKKTVHSKPVSTAKILLGASMIDLGISGARHAQSSDVYTKTMSSLFALSGYTIAKNGAYNINKARNR